MIERLSFQGARGRFVSENDVEPMRLQLINQRSDFALATNDMDRIREAKSSSEDLERDQLGERIGNPDVQPQRSLVPGPLLHCVH